MKKLMMTLGVLALLTGARANQVEDSSASADAHDAIIFINHIGWEVSRIMAMTDRLSLESEYEMISIDQLNLGAIKNEEIVAQIRELCSYITRKRIAIGEQEMLQREYDYNRDNALYDAFPSPSAILVADWRVIAYNLVQSTVCAYMTYKKSVAALKIRFERDQWNLEKDMMRDLDSLYQELLEKQQKLIQQYKLDDYWRVSPKQAKELVSRIENADTDDRREDLFKYLNHVAQRKVFQKLPAFWYYLGDIAERVGQKDVAVDAYKKYQDEFCQILRFDRTAASVAMNMANLLLEKSAEPSLVREQLKIIEKNMTGDWTFMYYCANVYYRLKDVEDARRTLDQANSILRHGFDDAMQNADRLCETNELAATENNLPNAMPMIACQMLKLKLDGGKVDKDSVRKMLEESQRKWGQNCYGMLSFYGQIPFEEIESYLRPCFKGIYMEYQYDDSMFNNSAPYRFVLDLPLGWHFAGPIDVSAVVKFDDGKTDAMRVGLHPRYKGVNPRITTGRSVQYVLDCPSEIVRYRSPISVELMLGHKMYPVSVVFDATKLKDVRKTGDKSFRLPLIEGHYKKKIFPLR